MSAPDLRAEVLKGLDRELEDLQGLTSIFPNLPGNAARTALRHLREIVEMHQPCCGDVETHDPYSEHVGAVFCAVCSHDYPCPTLLSLAPDYAPQALKEMEADR